MRLIPRTTRVCNHSPYGCHWFSNKRIDIRRKFYIQVPRQLKLKLQGGLFRA